jgi:hypothetical protein
MKRSLKYPAKLFKKFDVSPLDKNGIVKFVIFISWIFFVLTYISIDFIPDESSSLQIKSKTISGFTEELSPVELPAITNIKFSRSEIGTVSSYNIIILPHEPLPVDRERGPPFHTF